MTREEAIEYLKRADVTVGREIKTKTAKALEMAIKALEQEPFINKPCVSSGVCGHDKNKVLDKIRTEIKKSSHGKWYVGRLDGKTEEVLLLDEVLQIIDKYKAEIEPQKSEEI